MLAVVWAKIQAAWRYSRIIFINAASLALIALDQLVAFGLQAEWSALTSNPKTLFFIMAVLNVANIVLRLRTSGPVGGK